MYLYILIYLWNLCLIYIFNYVSAALYFATFPIFFSTFEGKELPNGHQTLRSLTRPQGKMRCKGTPSFCVKFTKRSGTERWEAESHGKGIPSQNQVVLVKRMQGILTQFWSVITLLFSDYCPIFLPLLRLKSQKEYVVSFFKHRFSGSVTSLGFGKLGRMCFLVCVCVCQGDRLIDVQHVLFVAGFDGYELFVFCWNWDVFFFDFVKVWTFPFFLWGGVVVVCNVVEKIGGLVFAIESPSKGVLDAFS